MSHTIIDRRKNDKKSSVNRKKFLQRTKGVIKQSIKELIRNTDLQDLASNKSKKIKIPARGLDQPVFHHTRSGINDIVIPGNDAHMPEDLIDKPPEGGEGNTATEDGEGVDSFVFHLTRDEFLDLLFEDCALPDMMQKSLAILEENEVHRSGYTTSGSPATLNIIRSFKQAKTRRRCTQSSRMKNIAILEQQLANLEESLQTADLEESDIIKQEIAALQIKIKQLKTRAANVPFIDPVDLYYNNWDVFPNPTTQAVMVCMMDVSGSMDEIKKQISKIFFLMLYLFLHREYKQIDVRYIRYHSKAKVATEEEFYHDPETGGTVTSTGVDVMIDLINTEYPPDAWNIYVAHASDGDNFLYDNDKVKEKLITRILPICQYYAYVQVDPDASRIIGMTHDTHSLIEVFNELKQSHSNIGVSLVTNETEIYPVFRELFKRKQHK